MWIHIAGRGSFYLRELISCVSEGLLYKLLGIHNIGMGAFVLVDMETFDLHGLI